MSVVAIAIAHALFGGAPRVTTGDPRARRASEARGVRSWVDLDLMVGGSEVSLADKDVYETPAADGSGMFPMAPGLANGMLPIWLGAIGREVHPLCAKAHELVDFRAFAEYIFANAQYRGDLAPGIENGLLYGWLRSFSLTDEWGRECSGVWKTPLEELPVFSPKDWGMGGVFRHPEGGRIWFSPCQCGGDPSCGWCTEGVQECRYP
jgi:hypothetical protein